jgi:2-keto-4-pentenoate hydratase/2-oxohepta-3-ene-1,7-dioic acid hydratase in catechol pathway
VRLVMGVDPARFAGVASLGARLANLELAPDGPTALGVETAHGVVVVPIAAKKLALPAPQDMDDLLQEGRAEEVRAVLDALDTLDSRSGGAAFLNPSEVRFAPLVTRPQKIVCVGFNYREHAEETGTPIPPVPPLFNKYNNSLNRHGGTIALPTRVAYQFDYETELVIVMGREARDVAEDQALAHVAGYATGNDFSARDLQTATTQFMIGKTSDGFAPIGPWLVTADRVPDPNSLRLQTHVNGELRQDWNTSDMIFNCAQVISFASGIFPLSPGDIIFTGTPQGVIFGQKEPREHRAWLKAGDEVTSELEGLGRLTVTLA